MSGVAASFGAADQKAIYGPTERLRIGLQPIADRNLFCTWRKETSGSSQSKPRKVPYVRGGFRLTGQFNSPDLPSKLMTLAEAITECQGLGFDGVGLVFIPGCGVVGVDFDHCLDASKKLAPTLAQRKALTLLWNVAFIERSQSDTGLHAIVLGDAPTLKANGELEIFGDKNFLALTGFAGRGIASDIDKEVVTKLVGLVVEIKEGNKKTLDVPSKADGGTKVVLNDDLTGHLSRKGGNEPLERVANALSFINPDIERDSWLKIIFAIRHGLGDTADGFALADKWSKGDLYAGR